MILDKGNTPTDYDASELSFYEAAMVGSAQMQTIGWQAFASPFLTEPLTLGSTGQGKRLEAITVSMPKVELDGAIEYQTHVQSYGWMGWKSNGAVSGTEGEAKRIEAVQMRLTGVLADEYDIYYRSHVSKIGWMDWAKNGESSGTQQCKAPIEAIQVVLVKRGGKAPGATSVPFIDGANLQFRCHVEAFL